MKCPKCGKDLELQKKQVGVDENGKPVFNEYAICRDCKKQWNLDKQRAKMTAKKADENPSPAASSEKKHMVSERKTAADNKVTSFENRPARPTQKAASSVNRTARPTQKAVSSENRTARPTQKTAASVNKAVSAGKKAASSVGNTVPTGKKVTSSDSNAASANRKQASSKTKSSANKSAAGTPSTKTAKPANSQRYGNIPPEKIRTKHEQAVRSSYEEMLATDPNSKFAKKKKASAEAASSRKPKRSEEPVKKTSTAKSVPEIDEEQGTPKFRVLRIILGLISIIAFGFFAYKGFLAGLNNISSGSADATGTTYIILAICMLLSGLLLLILNKKRTIFAFLFPMLFYIGSAVFAFLKRGNDNWLLYGAVFGAVFAVISLILAIASGRGDDDGYDDEYDDTFDE